MRTRTVRSAMVCGLLAASLHAAAFAQKSSAPAKIAADYWPFKEGSTWTIDTTVGEKKMTQVITVRKATTKEGKTRAELEYVTDKKIVQVEIYEVNDKSLVRLASGKDGANKLTPPFPVIQFPLTDGKKWQWKGEIATENGTFKGSSEQTVSGPETVKTDAGTFSATRVHVDLEIMAGEQTLKVVNDYWFAPNVGLVKQKATIGPQVIEGILTSYKLAK